MPKIVTDTEMEHIVNVVRSHPQGARLHDILQVESIRMNKRTLQRRLERLVSTHQLSVTGMGPGRRYFGNAEINASAFVGIKDAQTDYDAKIIAVEETLDWMSDDSKAIHSLLQQPVNRRTPVGYERTFLERYIPNKTYYLKESLRRELFAMGNVNVHPQPAGTYLRLILDRLLIDLSWNSSRLEGNTYSQLETQQLLKNGMGANGKRAEETQMILNHKAAIEMLADQADEIGFNLYTICNLHALLSDNLLVDPAAMGRIRTRAVAISGSVFYPLEIPQQITDELNLLLHKAATIEDPFEQAFFALVHLPYLQPFEDVNKRVSRLAANIPFVQRNLCPLSFVDVTQHDYVAAVLGVYELNRIEYLRDLFVYAYGRSCARYKAVRQSLGDPDPFRLRYREQIKAVVHQMVVEQQVGESLTAAVAQWANAEISPADVSHAIDVVYEELNGLHEGNIARYRLFPRTFLPWYEKAARQKPLQPK